MQRDDDEESIADEAGSMFDSAVETVSGTINEGVAGIGDVVETVSGGATEVLDQAVSGAKEGTEGVQDQAVSGAKEATEGALDLAGDAAGAVAEGAGAVGETLGEIGGGIASGVSGLLGGLGGGEGEGAGVLTLANDVSKTTSGDETLTSCEPFDDPAVAEQTRIKLGAVLMGSATALFGTGVGKLWAGYISGGTGLQVLTDPTIIQAFASTGATLDAADEIAGGVKAQLDAAPAIADGVHSLEDEKVLRRGLRRDIENRLSFDNPFSIPGHIAGGIGRDQGASNTGARPSQIDDDRRIGGTAAIETQKDGTRTVTVSPRFTVTDTIDFCPGNKGAALELALTVPLSKCEAQGIVGDVPFKVTYDTIPDTLTFGTPPENPFIRKLKKLDPFGR